MKLLVLSDLHLEMAPFVPPVQAVRQADVVVLAGDIHTDTQGLAWAAQAFPGKPVVYVAGNHEFYGGHWEHTLAHMRLRAGELDIHLLENDAVTLGGVRFLGCSLWTDFDLGGPEQHDAAMRAAWKSMMDYRRIHVDSASLWLTPQHTLDRHRESRSWLARTLAEPAPHTVVVTHHFPSRRSVSPRFTGDSLNPAFGSDLPEGLLTKAGLWVHGHTHDSVAYAVGSGAGGSRVVCNPRGYPLANGRFENPGFDAGCLVST